MIQTEEKTNRDAGFTLIELIAVVSIIALVATFVIPGLLDARKTTNERATLANLRSIGNAQEVYKSRRGTFGTLPELVAIGLLDTTFSDSLRQGYLYTGTGAVYTWTIRAAPADPGRTGDRYFFLDESGVIRFNTVGPAGATDSAIQ